MLKFRRRAWTRLALRGQAVGRMLLVCGDHSLSHSTDSAKKNMPRRLWVAPEHDKMRNHLVRCKIYASGTSPNLGQDELISYGNGLNDSWINNDDTYTGSDYSIDSLVREPWFRGLSNTPGAVDCGRGNLE